ncbi:putative phage baseplate assembly protein [Paenibacillus cellulosilyticus]|uniref:Putative phage baseplate assembly protein n=1 Tax=Paenibacillus cellulosilyticus TaxID=375489 RepID=A0A2V2YR10_9BACL|nr:putative baseplate assembly protein [Paenibacillus cellulosilyticus]PWV95678.1 putative phage baseplate assembly protein [Paenibacillus cellulosilyticus]QKS47686.1 putative baseplate assembly protein [Paenibacillus cellulosilyticus]
MRAPLIDGRDVGRIIEQLLELAPYYVPEWNALSEHDPAAAVIRIFAGQYVDTLDRLNRVPDKNLMTYLSKLGVSLLPATPARVPVTFRLSAGLKEPVLIPARTQTAAPPSDGGKPIVFETTRPMLATPARITEMLSATAGADGIYAAPPGMAEQLPTPFWAVIGSPVRSGDTQLFVDSAKGLQPGDLLDLGGMEYAEVLRAKDNVIALASPLVLSYAAGTEVNRVTAFKLFMGLNKQDSYVYIAENDLLQCSALSTIKLLHETLNEQGGSAVTDESDRTQWQYWDGAWINLQHTAGGLRPAPGSRMLGSTEVNGQRNRWLRGRIPTGADYTGRWRIAVQGDIGAPDLMFSNNNPVGPLDKEEGFYLFGESPRTGDTLYIASAEALSKQGGLVTLSFMIGNAEEALRLLAAAKELEGEDAEAAFATLFTDEVSWEYWNGGGWLRLNRRDIAYDSKNDMVQIQFDVGIDAASLAVQGQESYWIRCRLMKLDPSGKLEVTGKKLLIRKVNIAYQSAAPAEQVLTYRNLRYQDRTAGSSTEAAEALDQEQALYLGFDRAPLRGPISLYFSLLDQLYDPDRHPIVEWQYYAEKRGGSGWVKLDANDGTDHLTRSGCVEFVGLPDWTETDLFGRSRFWLRAVDTTGVFQAAGSMDENREPAPVVLGLYRNTTIAEQVESYRDEMVGSSRGTPNALFTVSKVPVITEQLYVDERASLTDRERQQFEEDGTVFMEDKDDKGAAIRLWVRWTSVDTLSGSGEGDRHYVIDRTTGVIRFGDGIHGMIPPIGTNNVKLNYQCGGGVRGNVAASTIAMLKSSIAYVDGVTNPVAAAGGYDTENEEAARVRGPQMVRHRYRAVTAADYESLVFEASRGIARVQCLPNTNERGDYQLGRVTLLVVPQSGEQLPQPSTELRRTITEYVQQRAANVVAQPQHIHVRGPSYIEVSIRTTLVTTNIAYVPDAEREALRRLKSYLHPLSGHSDQRGWAFGSIPALSDLYVLLGSIPGLEYVERLEMTLRDANGQVAVITPMQQAAVDLSPHILIYSGDHHVVVRSASK